MHTANLLRFVSAFSYCALCQAERMFGFQVYFATVVCVFLCVIHVCLVWVCVGLLCVHIRGPRMLKKNLSIYCLMLL